MSRAIEDGYDEIEVHVSKTIQEEQFEPLKFAVTLKRMIKPEEISSEVQDITEILENEIADAFRRGE